jgi:hypothetical protein
MPYRPRCRLVLAGLVCAAALAHPPRMTAAVGADASVGPPPASRAPPRARRRLGTCAFKACGPVTLDANGASDFDCTSINGDVAVQGWQNPDLTVLTCLTALNGDLIIVGNNNLETLHGLQNLGEVLGDVIVENNGSLQSLHGLEGLSSVSGGIVVRDNDVLLGMHALAAVSVLGKDGQGRSITVQENPMLLSLDGLESLPAVIEGSVSVKECPSLTSIGALARVTRMEAVLEIDRCASLESLSGLEAVTRVGTTLKISNNGRLTTLDGLASLRRVGTQIQVQANGALGDLYALCDLEGANSVTLMSNAVTVVDCGACGKFDMNAGRFFQDECQGGYCIGRLGPEAQCCQASETECIRQNAALLAAGAGALRPWSSWGSGGWAAAVAAHAAVALAAARAAER